MQALRVAKLPDRHWLYEANRTVARAADLDLAGVAKASPRNNTSALAELLINRRRIKMARNFQAILSAGQSTARSCHPYQAINVKAPAMMKPVSTKNGGPVKGCGGAAAAENSQVAAATRIPNAKQSNAARCGKATAGL